MKTFVMMGASWALLAGCDTTLDAGDADLSNSPAVRAPAPANARVVASDSTGQQLREPGVRVRLRPGRTVTVPSLRDPAPPTVSQFAFPFSASFDGDDTASQWTLSGAWTTTDVAPSSGPRHLRVDPASAAGPIAGPIEATMKGFVALPTDRPAELSLWYRADLGGDDRVALELQASDAATWTHLMTFDSGLTRDAYAHVAIPLDRFEGRAVRVRLRLEGAGAAGLPCVMDVDDLRISGLPEVGFAYPFEGGFDSAAARDAWRLGGTWAFLGDDADAALDANPTLAAQAGLADGNDATMASFVRVPVGRPVTLSYWYEAALGADDWMIVQVQTRERGVWQTVAAWSGEHPRPELSYAEHDLTPWQGFAVRARFLVRYADALAVRRATIDDVRIGGLVGPLATAPWQPDFAATDGVEGMSLAGAWDWVEGVDGVLSLSANPDQRAQGALRVGHTATSRAFVKLAPGSAPTLVMTLAGALADPADRVFVEAQRRSDGVWRTVGIIGDGGLDEDGRWHEIPLASFAGDAVRVRLRLAWGDAVAERAFEVSHLAIVDGVGAIVGFPYHEGFESDTNAWTLNGSWAIGGAHGDAAPLSGAGFLDGNPDEQALSGARTSQVASMHAWVELPVDVAAEASFSWHLTPAHPSDTLFLEAQAGPGADWRILAVVDAQRATEAQGWGDTRVDLGAWAGTAMRFRMRLVTGPTDAVRVVAIDDFAVAPAE